MVTRYDRNKVEKVVDLEKEFPNCHIIVLLETDFSTEGKLVAVSDNPATEDELLDIAKEFPPEASILQGGVYGRIQAGIQNFFS